MQVIFSLFSFKNAPYIAFSVLFHCSLYREHINLPIALTIMACMGKLDPAALSGTAIIGEVALDGSVRPVRGALPMVISALEAGVKRFLLPADNENEVRCVEGIDLYCVSSLTQAAEHLSGKHPLPPVKTVAYSEILARRESPFDFKNVKGQAGARRALEIAAAGSHNILMIGPPGSGKTLMARCVPSILPDMTFQEALEVTRIHSVAGAVPETGLLVERPFRSPHHTASHAALVGGGTGALPGEVSKSHNGVLRYCVTRCA